VLATYETKSQKWTTYFSADRTRVAYLEEERDPLRIGPASSTATGWAACAP
jgi:hypothetical protein